MAQRAYQDDLVHIPPGSRLIRRIAPQFVEWGGVDSAGNPYLKSQAMQLLDSKRAAMFGCPGPGMSIIIEALADPVSVLVDRYAGQGLAYIEEGMIRSDTLGIDFWPTDDEPAHGVVFRFDGGHRLPGAVKTALAEYARSHFIVHPAR